MTSAAISNFVTAVLTAFVISAGSAMAIGWKDQGSDSLVLKQNTEAITQLTQAVQELRISTAVAAEKYVTRTELESKLKERH